MNAVDEADTLAERGSAKLHVAYLINQYPKVSHSFIRREILAVERQGVKVDRLALRGWDAQVVDEEDVTEQKRTRYVLKNGLLPLFIDVIKTFATRPRRFLGAFAVAVGCSRRSERSLPYHLVYLAHACRILGWLQQSGASHIHAHFGTNSAEVAMLVHLLGGPGYSFTVHGADEMDKGQFLALDKKVANAKFAIAISSFTRCQLFRRCDLEDWGKIKIVHCGLAQEFYAIPPSDPPVERRLVCVGRLCAEKAQIILLEALGQVIKNGEDCNLVLAGDGEMRPQIEEKIKILGLERHVRITGWISSEHVRTEILKARALVLPSFQEGLPVVIMEAMVLKRPVISTYIAGIPELVQDGKTGWLVPAGDITKLATAMEDCLSAPTQELKAMAEVAHNRVVERHAIDREALKLIGLFKQRTIKNVIEEWHI